MAKRIGKISEANDTKGFTMVELMLTVAIAGIILAGAATTLNLWARSSMAVGNYADMSGSTRRALDIFASDVRMATDVSTSSANRFTFTAYGSGTSTVAVDYRFDAGVGTLTRTYDGVSQVILQDVDQFLFAYLDMNLSATTNPLSVKVVRIESILQKRVLNISNTDEIISARFMLRNRQVSS
jgi:prepilin-type N-terminal cleavage/methylation domain-containing protein